MTRSTRRAVFYVLVALFFIIGVSVVLYAEGWRIDFATWRPQKVGGVFVRSFPENANISLDGTPASNEAGILSQGTLVSDLYPKTYTLTLTENGYANWHEEVNVLPSLVTEVKDAVLIPQNPVVIASTTSIKNFSVVSGEPILQTASNTVTWRNETIGFGSIASVSTDLNDVIIENTTTNLYSLYDLAAATSMDLSTIAANNGMDPKTLTSVAIDPYDATEVIIGTPQKIGMIDAAQGTFSIIAQASSGVTFGPAVAETAADLAWSETAQGPQNSKASAIALYDTFAKTTAIGSSTIPGMTQKLTWIGSGTLAVLQNDGSLYLYGVGTGEFKTLADSVKNFSVSPDGDDLAAIEGQSLEIFSFTSDGIYHRFNVPDITDVTNALWYKDDTHLFIVYPDHVSFLDLADAGLDNFTTATEGTAPFYDPKTNSLYYLDPHEELMRLDFPS